MTAQDIRAIAAKLAERQEYASAESVTWLAEIAAQLAEMNDTLNHLLQAVTHGR